jgi:cyclopropane fatty-acyl-phospholipid synthase-like methyltransferase
MDKQEETRNTWNNIAGLYNDKFMDLTLYDATYDYVCDVVALSGAKILDVGCGPGNITKYLLAKRPDFEILGIDIAENMLELARLNNPTARFELLDSRDIVQLKTSFDAIVAGFCLPYLSQGETADFIQQSYHSLNADGLLYLSFVEGDPAQSDFKSGSGGRVYFNYHPLEQLLATLRQANFDQIQLFKVPYKVNDAGNDIHTIVIARKK